MYIKILRQHLRRSDKQNNVSIYRNCCKTMQMAYFLWNFFKNCKKKKEKKRNCDKLYKENVHID